VVCVTVTVALSLATQPKPDAELTGLVYGLTEVPSVGDVPLYEKPFFWAGVVTVVFIVLNIIFW
jgi:SSS family solute:Na+ symporter